MQFDYEKAASIHLGAQDTFSPYGDAATCVESCVTAPSPRASLGWRTVCGRTKQRRPPVSKRYGTTVRIVWGRILITAAALKTPTIDGYMP